MTVRVNKSSFNIREKLSELAVKFGLKGSELMRAETAQEARDLVSAGRKNLVINGDMRIAQRGTSFAVAASGAFAADRWKYEASTNAEVTISQQTAWNNGPYWAHSIKVETTTARSSTASTNFGQFLYHIEANDSGRFRFGTSEAKPFTFSFWVKSNKTGKFPASFQNNNGSRVFPTDYTINRADTWEKKIIVVPGDISGSWNLYGNGTGMRFTLMWAMGSNFINGTKGAWATATSYSNLTTTAGDQMDVVGATLEFAQVQLEVGKNATDFEHRSYGEELALCQRYYYHHADASAKPVCNGAAYQSSRAFGVVHLPVTMRTSPSVIATSGPSNFRFFANGTSTGFSTLTLQENFNTAVTVETSNTLSVTAGHAGWIRTDAGALAFNAEL